LRSKGWFFNKKYQFSRDDVNIEPIAPTNWQNNTETKSLKIKSLNIFTLHHIIPKIICVPICINVSTEKL
jgi:hypothetical protein